MKEAERFSRPAAAIHEEEGESMTSAEILQTLARVPFFATLDAEELESLVRAAGIQKKPAGTLLIREGKPAGGVLVILEGETEVFKSYGQEGERRLGTRGPGTVLGEMSFFSPHQTHTATIQAVTPVLLFCLERDTFETLLIRYPKVTAELLRTVSRRLEDSETMTVIDLTEKNRLLEKALDDLQAAQEQLIEKEKLEHELELASQIQQSLLPRELPSLPGAGLAALTIPARAVGGDFYGFLAHSDGRTGMFAGDVSDKGMPAALGMALVLSLLHAEGSRKHHTPAQILTNVNQHLLEIGAANTFVTLLFGFYDPPTGRFSYARAGHPLPVLLSGQGELIPVQQGLGQALGIFEPVVLDVQEVQLPPGGMMLMYSDGVSEAANPQGDQFGVERLQLELQALEEDDPHEVCQRVLQAVRKYTQGQPGQDDLTLVCLRRGAD